MVPIRRCCRFGYKEKIEEQASWQSTPECMIPNHQCCRFRYRWKIFKCSGSLMHWDVHRVATVMWTIHSRVALRSLSLSLLVYVCLPTGHAYGCVLLQMAAAPVAVVWWLFLHSLTSSGGPHGNSITAGPHGEGRQAGHGAQRGDNGISRLPACVASTRLGWGCVRSPHRLQGPAKV